MATIAIPLIMSAIGGLGGLLGNKSSTQKQESTTNQSQHTDQSTTPQYDPKSQALRDMLINAFMSNMQGNEDYFGGYTANGLSEINKSTDSSQRAMENYLASRGIQGPAAGAGLSAPLLARQGLVSNFMNSIPQLKDQRQQGLLASGSQFLSSLPVGQHTVGDTTGTSTTKGSQTNPGNPLGGLFQGLGTTMAGLYGAGAFGGGGSGSSGGGGGSFNSNFQMPTTFGSNPWLRR